MNMRKLEQLLRQGRVFRVRYEYPGRVRDGGTGSIYKTRTDRLLDVCPRTRRLFVRFDDRSPIWIESYEVVEVIEQGAEREERLVLAA